MVAGSRRARLSAPSRPSGSGTQETGHLNSPKGSQVEGVKFFCLSVLYCFDTTQNELNIFDSSYSVLKAVMLYLLKFSGATGPVFSQETSTTIFFPLLQSFFATFFFGTKDR